MRKFILTENIVVICYEATSFPEGISDSHTKLFSFFADAHKRKRFGISRPENGKIKYMAAIEQLVPFECMSLNLQTFEIVKGKYISLLVKDFHSNLYSIDAAFKKLITHPGIDPNGYCLEWYLNENDVLCLIPIIS